MSKEIFAEISGYPNYAVSNRGNVKSIRRDKLLKPFDNGFGYKRVALINGKLRQQYYVHRLVCETFLDNLEHKAQVNHRDGNKSNNNLNNLEWVTGSENCIHAWNNGLQPENKKKMPVYQIDRSTNKILREYESISEASKKTNVGSGHIYLTCMEDRPSAGGFRWEFKHK